MNDNRVPHRPCRSQKVWQILRILAVFFVTLLLVAPSAATAPSQVLTPTYQWHLFFGSANNDSGSNIALDNNGDIYVVGTSLATWNGPQGIPPRHAHSGSSDIMVVKLNSSGDYQWHTFYGSAAADVGHDIVVDSNGNVYIVAQSNVTWQGDGNTDPEHGHSGDWDIVVVKLDHDGNYQWHTFYGSSSADYGYGITVDSQDDVLVAVTGEASWNGPTGQAPINAFTVGGLNMGALKLDGDGNYQWHTFYRSYSGIAIAVDTGDNPYLVGYCDVDWNGPEGQLPLHARTGMTDLLVVKLTSSGAYQWHTFYGSNLSEVGYGITTDSSGDVYVLGYSGADWNGPAAQLPLHAFTGDPGATDIVVLNLDSNGAYQWHTFYGSASNDFGRQITVDGYGNVFVTGYSEAGWNGPSSTPPLHTYSGGTDIVGFRLTGDGDYRWHTFYGSASDDYGYGVAVDGRGAGYLTGASTAGWQGDGNTAPLHDYTGGLDAVVVKLQIFRVCLPLVLRP